MHHDTNGKSPGCNYYKLRLAGLVELSYVSHLQLHFFRFLWDQFSSRLVWCSWPIDYSVIYLMTYNNTVSCLCKLVPVFNIFYISQLGCSVLHIQSLENSIHALAHLVRICIFCLIYSFGNTGVSLEAVHHNEHKFWISEWDCTDTHLVCQWGSIFSAVAAVLKVAICHAWYHVFVASRSSTNISAI